MKIDPSVYIEPGVVSKQEAVKLALAALTPEQEAARVARGERNCELTVFLWERLFGYTNVRLVTEGFGNEIVSKAKRSAWVKGFYGTDPETGKEKHLSPPFVSDVNSSRFIVKAMIEKGFAAGFTTGIGKSGYATVTFTRADYVFRTFKDPDEAFAVCAAARLVLESL